MLILDEYPLLRTAALVALQGLALGFGIYWSERRSHDGDDFMLYLGASFICGVAIAFGTRQTDGELQGLVNNPVTLVILGLLVIACCIGATLGSLFLFSKVLEGGRHH